MIIAITAISLTTINVNYSFNLAGDHARQGTPGPACHIMAKDYNDYACNIRR